MRSLCRSTESTRSGHSRLGLVVRASRPLVLLLLLGVLAGCNGGASSGGPYRRTGKVDPDDKIEAAKRITSNLKEATRLVDDVYEDMTSGRRDRYLATVPTLEKAEALLVEARDLTRDSATPRIRLGEVRSTLGIIAMGDRDHWQGIVDDAEARGQKPPADAVAKRDAAQTKAVDWLEGANREYEFYLRYLASTQPINSVYMKLSANYELLRNYAAAEQMIRSYLERESNIDREGRTALERRARGLRQRRLDELSD